MKAEHNEKMTEVAAGRRGLRCPEAREETTFLRAALGRQKEHRAIGFGPRWPPGRPLAPAEGEGAADGSQGHTVELTALDSLARDEAALAGPADTGIDSG